MTSVDFRCIPFLFAMIPLFFTSTDIVDLCPLTSFCGDRGNQTPDTWHQPNSCCLPCSCHKNCQLVGNCCHDADVDGSLQKVYTCTSQQAIYDKYLSLHYTSTDDSNVRVITDCHDDEVNVSNETIFRCRNAVKIEDLTFVTGKTSGVTYLNKHCARCNGEDDVEIWNLYIVSEDAEVIFSTGTSHESRDEYLLSTGIVMSVPPTDFAGLSTVCLKRTIDKCNVTSKWGVYNAETEDNCKSYTFMFFEEQKLFVYKNSFCYMCNQSPRVVTNIDLSRLSCESVVEYFLSSHRVRNDKFTTLIQTTRSDDVSDAKVSKPCNYGETMDLFSMKCVPFLCPPGTAVVEDHCQPLFEDDSGVVMYLSFYVVLENSTELSLSQYKPLLYELRAMISSKMREHEPLCEFCNAMYFYRYGSFIFSVSFISSRGCSYLQYIKQIAMIYKQTPIEMFSKSMQGNVTLNRGNFTYETLFRYNFPGAIYEKNKNIISFCSNKIHFSEDIIPCTSIMISKADVDSLSLKSSLKDEIMSLGTCVGNGTVRICLEDYNKIYTLTSSTPSTNSPYIKLMLIFSYAVYILNIQNMN